MAKRTILTVSVVFVWALATVAAAATPETRPTAQITVKVKYVVQDAVYLDGGRDLGLGQGMKLSVYHHQGADVGLSRPIAELEVLSVAANSAVCEVRSSETVVSQGDVAVLSARDQGQIELKQASRDALKYPQVVSFSEGDPIDEELREYVPQPRLPEINRFRGRIGFEAGALSNRESSRLSSHAGITMRADMTRIAGTFWGFKGYYRGRLDTRRNRQDETLHDLMSRTYQFSLSYNNPQSNWLLGFGRLHVPWASSLSTIDGGFMGRRLPRDLTVGLFAGSAPDPTSWRYAPDRQLAGAFVNLETGSFESVHFSSTAGLALNRLKHISDRQFGFFENNLFYKRFLSVYQNLEVDYLAEPSETRRSMTPSRSYTTVRVQPSSFVSFDVSHNYFREVPTFDSRLIGTGLVDRLLFQGLSAGVRVELPHRIAPYASLGHSTRSGDREPSWNRMFGLYLGEIWRTGVRADARHSKFDGPFGVGSYSSLSLSREVKERLRLELQGGGQHFKSSMSPGDRAFWLGLNADWMLGHYFLGGGITLYRGDAQNYNQWLANFGYRF